MENNFIDDLFKEVEEPNEDKKEKEKEKNINKDANIIKDLNKNDQNKVILFLKDIADDNNKKDQIEKVSNLVHNKLLSLINLNEINYNLKNYF